MIKAGSILVAISSISIAHANSCSAADKAFFTTPDTPSLDLISKCTPQTINSDFYTNCFSGSMDAWVLVGNPNVSQTCANCIFETMLSPLANESNTVRSCLSAANHTIDGTDCAPQVDSIILDSCGAAWAEGPSGNDALSMASSIAVAGAMIVATWSA